VYKFAYAATVTAALWAVPAPASTLALDPATTITFVGDVDEYSVGKALSGIRTAVAAGADEVTLVLDSYGGYVDEGLRLTTAMSLWRAQGVTFRCAVTGNAMSMGFWILAQCDSRYALPYSQLLWHPVRVGIRGAVTAQRAQELADHLKYFETQMQDDLIDLTGAEREWFLRHWFVESTHHGRQLAEALPDFIEVIDAYTGMPPETIMWMPNPLPGLFDFSIPSDTTADNTLIWRH
jgi:ATP-dependent protease ClpP protease subunit